MRDYPKEVNHNQEKKKLEEKTSQKIDRFSN